MTAENRKTGSAAPPATGETRPPTRPLQDRPEFLSSIFSVLVLHCHSSAVLFLLLILLLIRVNRLPLAPLRGSAPTRRRSLHTGPDHQIRPRGNVNSLGLGLGSPWIPPQTSRRLKRRENFHISLHRHITAICLDLYIHIQSFYICDRRRTLQWPPPSWLVMIPTRQIPFCS
jgi:hypothetical protein